jgi:hypothetical protein
VTHDGRARAGATARRVRGGREQARRLTRAGRTSALRRARAGFRDHGRWTRAVNAINVDHFFPTPISLFPGSRGKTSVSTRGNDVYEFFYLSSFTRTPHRIFCLHGGLLMSYTRPSVVVLGRPLRTGGFGLYRHERGAGGRRCATVARGRGGGGGHA